MPKVYFLPSRLQDLIVNILKNHFGLLDTSHLIADTRCEVYYFRKDSFDTMPPPPVLRFIRGILVLRTEETPGHRTWTGSLFFIGGKDVDTGPLLKVFSPKTTIFALSNTIITYSV